MLIHSAFFTDGHLPTLTPVVVFPSKGGRAGLFRSLDHARVEFSMATGMLGEMVAPHEPLLTKWASKLLLPSVGSVVPC